MLLDYIYLAYMLADFLNRVLFKIGLITVTPGKIFLSLFLVLFLYLLRKGVKHRLVPAIKKNYDITSAEWNRLKRILNFLFGIVATLVVLWIFEVDQARIESDNISIRAIYLLIAILIFQVARLVDWVMSNIFIHHSFVNRDKKESRTPRFKVNQEDSAIRAGQFFVYVLAILLFIRVLNLDPALFPHELEDGTRLDFKLSSILIFILIILGARLLIWVFTQLLLYNVYKRNGIDQGAQYSINQLLKYVVYTIAFIVALDSLGIDMTLLLGGAAALLVGVGLGLQSTFNDFISGVVLLFERSVEVGDILDVEGLVGEVKKIGLRASIIEIWDSTTVLVPNSKLVNQKVINWTHFNDIVRHQIKIGVAYGSDTALVKKILLEVINDNPFILKDPASFVRFEDFGDSALDFSIYFFSKSYRVIADIKSDLRFEIDRRFREANIGIPFPQREIWLRKEN